MEEKRHKCAKKRDTSVGVEILLEEHRHRVGVETLFGGKETPVSEKRHFWWKRDTYNRVETL